MYFWYSSIWYCFCMGNSVCGTHHAVTYFFTRYLVKMWYIVVFSTPDICSISYTVIRLSSTSNVDTITIKVLSIAIEGRALFATYFVNLLCSWNRLNHRATVPWFTLLWLHASRKLTVIIGTVLSLKHSILIYVALFLWHGLNKFLGLLHHCLIFLDNVIWEKIFIHFVCKTPPYALMIMAQCINLVHYFGTRVVQDFWNNLRI